MRAADCNSQRHVFIIAGLLAVVTFALFLPSLWNNFINYDDGDYIINNPHVNSGLTWANIVWAFTHAYVALWIPLTWISHMMDCQWFGLHPAGHHLVSLLIHIANALLLFFWLNQLTDAMWRSALVAALFAWHPLRVESVAWAAERKDVLSMFFWMLALIAYTRFVVESKVKSPKSKLFYVLVVLAFACGLMSKPMVVTLPFVLLLIDFWPLRRTSNLKLNSSNWFRQLVEKIPFFALTVAVGVLTSITSRSAVWSGLSPEFRAANGAVSYLRYVSKTFWPSDLAIIYPYPHHWPLSLVVVAVFFLIVWSAVFIARVRQQPYLLMGWLWFLGTLVPVIGLRQAGLQSMADRFTYIPSIGLFILLVWGMNDLLPASRNKNQIAALLGATALAGCLIMTSLQLRYWESSVTLFKHTLSVTTDNYLAEDCLGQTLERVGRPDDALALYADSVRIEPGFPLGQHKLGMMLLEKGREQEASNHLAVAAQLAPGDPVMQYDFGIYLLQHGNPVEAAKHFQAALAAKTDFSEAKDRLKEIIAAHPELTNSAALDSRH